MTAGRHSKMQYEDSNMTVMIPGEDRDMTVIGAPSMIKVIRERVKMTDRNAALITTEQERDMTVIRSICDVMIKEKFHGQQGLYSKTPLHPTAATSNTLHRN